MLALLLAGPIAAQDGTRIGIGMDASRGDYGGTLDTDIVSVPVSLQLRKGRWQFDASVPWLRVSGDRNVVPSFGALPGLGTLVGGAAPGTERVTTSGPGDLQLSARRALDTGGPLGIALSVRAKIATTDAERGLGTGANDYGVTADVYRKVGGWDWVLWYPMYFLRGFAIHGYPSVPAYPASHGCVRVPMWIAPQLYSSMGYGQTIYVYW